jgi:hypothetical protein
MPFIKTGRDEGRSLGEIKVAAPKPEIKVDAPKPETKKPVK